MPHRANSAILVTILISGCLLVDRCTQVRAEEQSVAFNAAEARELFTRHCAGCHGNDGKGDGFASWLLFPKPRDLRRDRIRLVSTTRRLPTLEDIEAILERGMPGSAMPPWSHLSEDERKLLAQEVQRLRREGLRQQYLEALEKEQGNETRQPAGAASNDNEIDEQDLKEYIAKRMSPGPKLEVPDFAAADAKSIARGKALYFKQSCHSCHGNQGKGDGWKTMIDDKGLPTEPRDLTRGIFKGGHDQASLYLRVALGMPGSPMPSSRETLSPQKMTDVVHFLRSLSDESARRQAVLRRERLSAEHVERLPESLDADAWTGVKPIQLRMTPLWWRNGADPDLEVRAVHDGRQLALRLDWRDATHDDGRDAETKTPVDGLGIQLFRGKHEPFLGLGGPSPVEVWYWRADDSAGENSAEKPPSETVPSETAPSEDGRDRSKLFPADKPGGVPPVPWERAANKAVRTFIGTGTVTFRLQRAEQVEAKSRWRENRWTVVMTRPLKVEDGKFGVSFEPGEKASVAFAIWNGSLHDEGGKKAITIWQDLVIEDRR